MRRLVPCLALGAGLLLAAPAPAQERPATPAAAAPTRNRPQIPKPPYPYAEREVSFTSPKAGATLAGTLTTPPGKGPFPAVVLVAGSGPAARDETILGHPIFKVLADHLTRQGIVVLRYDKRGIGASTGDAATATTFDFADDARAAVAFLRTVRGVDPRRVGIAGHSEGGAIGPIVAGADPKLAFVVLMAGPGVRGRELLSAQQAASLRAAGGTEAAVMTAISLQAQVFDIADGEPDPGKAKAQILTTLAAAGLPQAAADLQARAILSPWLRTFVAYDPAPALRALRIPVLALVGSKDTQVTAAQNIPALKAALADDPLAEVREVPDLNHLFQTAATGAFSEYGRIEETFSPVGLALISDWILKTPPR